MEGVILQKFSNLVGHSHFFSLSVVLMLFCISSDVSGYQDRINDIPKAIDLGIGEWPNRTNAISLMTQMLETELAKSKISSELERIKDRIDNHYNGEVAKYLEDRFPKKINVENGKSTYLIYFMQPYSSKDIETLNKLQIEYLHKNITVCGVLKPIVTMNISKGWKPKKMGDIPPNDPTFKKRNLEALNAVIRKMEKKSPQFLVGVDVARNDMNPEPPHTHYLKYCQNKKYFPTLVVVNKKSQLVWTGKVENVSYYIDKILNGKYHWNQYIADERTWSKISDYENSLTSEMNESERDEKNKKILNDLRNSPDRLMSVSRRLLSRSLFQFRDSHFALQCNLQALKVVKNKKDPRINASLANAYFEKGMLQKAIEHNSIDEYKKYKDKIGYKKFKALKEAELEFSTKYWPSIMGYVKKSDEDNVTTKNKISRGLVHDTLATAHIVYKMMKSAKFPYKDKVEMDFVEKLCKSLMTKVSESPNDHTVYAAVAMYEFRMNHFKKCIDLMSKAISLKPKHKNISSYRVILKQSKKKIGSK